MGGFRCPKCGGKFTAEQVAAGQLFTEVQCDRCEGESPSYEPRRKPPNPFQGRGRFTVFSTLLGVTVCGLTFGAIRLWGSTGVLIILNCLFLLMFFVSVAERGRENLRGTSELLLCMFVLLLVGLLLMPHYLIE